MCGERGGIDQEASPHWLRKAARNDNHSRSFGERSSGSSRRFRSLNTHSVKHSIKQNARPETDAQEATGAHRCWPQCVMLALIKLALLSAPRHQNVSISPLQRPVSACVCARVREGSMAQTSKEDWSRNCATPARLSLSGGSTANVDETRSCVDRRHPPSYSQTGSRKRNKGSVDGAYRQQQ